MAMPRNLYWFVGWAIRKEVYCWSHTITVGGGTVDLLHFRGMIAKELYPGRDGVCWGQRWIDGG